MFLIFYIISAISIDAQMDKTERMLKSCCDTNNFICNGQK